MQWNLCPPEEEEEEEDHYENNKPRIMTIDKAHNNKKKRRQKKIAAQTRNTRVEIKMSAVIIEAAGYRIWLNHSIESIVKKRENLL